MIRRVLSGVFVLLLASAVGCDSATGPETDPTVRYVAEGAGFDVYYTDANGETVNDHSDNEFDLTLEEFTHERACIEALSVVYQGGVFVEIYVDDELEAEDSGANEASACVQLKED